VPDPEAAALAEGHGHQQQGHQEQGHSQKGIAHSSPMVRSSWSRARHGGDVRGDLIKTIFTQVENYLLSMLHFLHAKFSMQISTYKLLPPQEWAPPKRGHLSWPPAGAPQMEWRCSA